MAAEPYVRRAAKADGQAGDAMLLRSDRDGAESWFVLAPSASQLWVNGRQAHLGIRVLSDRDEIRLANGPRFYFSTERLAQVVPFPGADHEILCARCKMPIELGSAAVSCPACSKWCHARPDLPCWSYKESPVCPQCGRPTNQAEFQWSPGRQ